MSDEPGSPSVADAEGAAKMLQLVEALNLSGAEGDARVTALLREIEAAAPGSIERMAAGLALRRIGWRGLTMQ